MTTDPDETWEPPSGRELYEHIRAIREGAHAAGRLLTEDEAIAVQQLKEVARLLYQAAFLRSGGHELSREPLHLRDSTELEDVTPKGVQFYEQWDGDLLARVRHPRAVPEIYSERLKSWHNHPGLDTVHKAAAISEQEALERFPVTRTDIYRPGEDAVDTIGTDAEDNSSHRPS